MEAWDMPGFSEKTVDFLIENTLNNSREWFAEHRARYAEHVAKPFAELAQALEPYVLAVDGGIVTKPSTVISRISRDTRFSKDKSLYRNNMWLVFARDKRDPACPAFWFELTPSGWSAGVGLYLAPPALMAAWRELILSGSPLFWEAKRACDGQAEFRAEGEFYKKPRCPGADPDLSPWLERKNIYFIGEGGLEEAFSPGLAECVGGLFERLAPCYRLLAAAWERSGVASGAP